MIGEKRWELGIIPYKKIERVMIILENREGWEIDS
jgi:hypothetical protein